MKPGEYLLDEAAGPLVANQGRTTTRVLVRNTGDRPVQVGSHFHFFEVNRELAFDRPAALGMRLNIAAGTAVGVTPAITALSPGSFQYTISSPTSAKGSPRVHISQSRTARTAPSGPRTVLSSR